MTETVSVDLGPRTYSVRIGQGLLGAAGREIGPLIHRPTVAIVTDENVARLHLDTLRASLENEGIAAATLAIPAGETSKSWQQLEGVVEWLLAQQIERGDVVIALGGGVIGDLVGFASAIVRRGVRFVQIPTSLLAQVDSSVGGKTGINSAKGKNLIGAFHQPSLVLADIGTLDTLKNRDFIAGYGEVLKYGCLGDSEFFDWLEANAEPIAKADKNALEHAVKRSVEMKAEIVARDETEQGDRALLNLGHTFAHALEAATGYSDRLLHGEAVSIGINLAFQLSAQLGLCPQESPSRVRAHIRAMGMKCDLADIDADLPGTEELIALMKQDKKVVDGRQRFVLVREIGDAFLADNVDQSVVRKILDDALAQAAPRG